jgi:hypothetical protein
MTISVRESGMPVDRVDAVAFHERPSTSRSRSAKNAVTESTSATVIRVVGLPDVCDGCHRPRDGDRQRTQPALAHSTRVGRLYPSRPHPGSVDESRPRATLAHPCLRPVNVSLTQPMGPESPISRHFARTHLGNPGRVWTSIHDLNADTADRGRLAAVCPRPRHDDVVDFPNDATHNNSPGFLERAYEFLGGAERSCGGDLSAR